MTILSLKATLLYWLHQAFLEDGEEEPGSFISFLQTDNSQGRFLRSFEPTISALTNPIWQNIPLQKKQNEADILYVSAMPQRLLQGHDSVSLLAALKGIEEPFKAISHQTVDRPKKTGFQSINCEPDHKDNARSLRFQLWAEFQIETQRPGWIAFRLCNRGIGLWLDQLPRLLCNSNSTISPDLPTLTNASFHTASASSVSSFCIGAVANVESVADSIADPMADSVFRQRADAMLWQVQYTHARCCTLMRLWQSICGELSESSTAEAAFDSVRSLQMSAHMTVTSEARLIHALIETTDDLFWIPYRWPSQQYFLLLKRAAQLCQSFDVFYAARLSGFGQLSHASSAADSAAMSYEFRFGFYLTAATENILKVLLCSYLSAEAPAEL